jgi:serine protease Do
VASLVTETDGQRRSIKVRMMPFEDMLKQKTGLTLRELNPQTAARLGLSSTDGLLVDTVEAGSPAAAAGLKSGVLLEGVDGTGIADLLDCGLAFTGKQKGDTATLNLIVPRNLGNGFINLVRTQLDLKVR